MNCSRHIRMQGEVLVTAGNRPRSVLPRSLHVAFKIPYVYDFIKKLCRQRAAAIRNRVHNIWRRKAQQMTCKGPKPSGGEAYDRCNDPTVVICSVGHVRWRHRLPDKALTDERTCVKHVVYIYIYIYIYIYMPAIVISEGNGHPRTGH
jgi:hypothetical protein